MHRRLAPVFFFALVASAGASAATSQPADLQAAFVNVDDPAVKEIRRVGERAVVWAANSVGDDASSSFVSYSPAGAVKFCHLKDLPKSGPVLPNLPQITAIKLTSLRLRNPANAPDAAEKLVLEHIRKGIETGGFPPILLMQRIDNPDGTKEWRVYRSLMVKPQCLACHGPAGSQSADLRAVLQDGYPSDAAVGYSAGEWRGVVRATVSEVAPAKPAPALPGTQPTNAPAPSRR